MGQRMSYEQCWRLIRRYALAAGVQVLDGERLRPANGRDFRHGAAVNPVRQGVPVSEVQQQLGHARIDSTSVYAKLANPERRAMADRVTWSGPGWHATSISLPPRSRWAGAVSDRGGSAVGIHVAQEAYVPSWVLPNSRTSGYQP
jgi:hypothetical protein